MTPGQAKDVLLRYRPGTSDERDPETIAALAAARADSDLRAWLEGQKAFQASVRAGLRGMEVPARLKQRLLAAQKVTRPPAWWWRPQLGLAAAALVLCVGLLAILRQDRTPDSWAHYQERMIATVLRQYAMDFVTPDAEQLRRQIAAAGGPSAYRVPAGLQKLSLTGGGVLRWRNQPVSMVCFDRGDKQMLYLFVVAAEASPELLPQAQQAFRREDIQAVQWQQEGYVYLLAGPDEPGFLEKYL